MHSKMGVSVGNGVAWEMVARALLGKAGLLLMVLVLASLAGGCAAQRAYASGKTAASAGEWDVAVEQYRQALIADPDNTEYRIALQRAMSSASIYHAERGRNADLRGQLEEAAGVQPLPDER